MRYLSICFIAFLLSISQFAHADVDQQTEPVQASLIMEDEAIQPGRPFWIITKLQLQEGWHTYWKNPGDAGMATSIEWQLPEGFTAGQIIWPTPKRFALDSVIGYGYDNEVMLLTEITPPKNLSNDKPIIIKADTHWLICSDSFCVPGQAELAATTQISTTPPASKNSNAVIFAKARGLIPEKQTQVFAQRTDDAIELHVPRPQDGRLPISVYFCPEVPDEINHTIDPIIKPSSLSPNHYVLSIKEISSENQIKNLKGVVVATSGRESVQTVQQSYDINVPIRNDLPDPNLIGMADGFQQADLFHGEQTDAPLAAAESEFSGGLAMALLLAFVGGMILNLMPCVLPVMSFKILSFVKMAGQSRSLTLKHGIAFSVGVMISFWALAGVLLVLQAYGRAVGWGFQLQEPLFVAALASVLLIFGLSLFGVFEIGAGLTSLAGSSKRKEGLNGSFLSGILATAVATPCTGPFLGSAVGYAVTLPALQAMLVFTSLGLGMSLPYLLLAAFPSLLRFMPKPGEWMETFKQLMGFLMLATVLWLVWVFGAQTSSFAITLLLTGFFCIAVACWIYGRWGSPIHSKISRVVSTVIALGCLVSGGYAIVLSTSTVVSSITEGQQQQQDIAWEPFSTKRIAELQKQGIPVLVDFTAKWCLICQVNHVVLSRDAIDEKLTDLGVVRMKADWTKNDPEITEELRKHGRNSVPLYLLYGKDPKEAPKIMPQVLTQDIVLDYLSKIE